MPPRKSTKKATTQAAKEVEAVPDSPLTVAQKAVNNVVENLEVLFEPSEEVATNMTNTVKVLYDYLKENESKEHEVSNALPTLLVEGFDSEQIWEQLKLQMDPMIETTEQVTDAVENKPLVHMDTDEQDADEFDEDDFDDEDNEMQFDDEDDDDENMDYIHGDASDDDDDDDEEKTNKSSKSKTTRTTKSSATARKSSIVIPKDLKKHEDGFFSWEDMHRFADEGEFETDPQAKLEMRRLRRRKLIEAGELEEDEEINDEDLLGEDEDDEIDVFSDVKVKDNEQFMYSDFFLPPDADMDEDAMNPMNFEGDIYEGGDVFEGDINSLFDMDGDEEFMKYDEDDEDDEEEQKALVEDDESKYQVIEDDEHVVDHLMTPFERKQQKLQEQIDSIEKQLMGPKAWNMVGETKGHKRELDVLLDSELDFEFATKMSMPITEEVASEIEQIIRARIKDNAFDDVQPRLPPPEKVFEPKEEVSSEKSKYGLAEIYEREYLQMAQGTSSDAQIALNKDHEEISAMFANLCHKLDALSNYFYTPKSKNIELSVTSSASAISMEEVLPLAVNDSIRAAPQEVFQAASHGLIASKEELDKNEKDALRRNQKQKKRKHFEYEEKNTKLAALAGDEAAKKKLDQKDMQQRYKQATQSKIITQGAKVDGTRYATSAQFFQKIQDTVQKEKAGIKVKKSNTTYDNKSKASAYMN